MRSIPVRSSRRTVAHVKEKGPAAARRAAGFGLMVLAAAAGLSLVSCRSVARAPSSAIETPAWHVMQGNALVAKAGPSSADLSDAESEFNKALQLAPKNAPAMVGLATVKLLRGELDAARETAKKARELDDKSPGSYVVMGRILSAAGGKNWIEEAGKEFRKAEEIAPDDPEGYFHYGTALARAYRYAEAKDQFAKVLELKKGLTEEANHEWEKMQTIERASPGTENGKRIALVDKLTRAEMGILFVDELGLVRLLEKKRPAVYDTTFRTPDEAVSSGAKAAAGDLPRDIRGHWGESALARIMKLKLRACSPMPDGSFQPDVLVTRAEFALMVEDVMVLLTGDDSLTRRYIGEKSSHFPDVRTDHPAYNAINLTVERGILNAGKDGRFGVSDTISGAESLLAIRTLSGLL